MQSQFQPRERADFQDKISYMMSNLVFLTSKDNVQNQYKKIFSTPRASV